MEKVDVQTLINSKSERLTFEPNKGRSEIWNDFVLVKVDDEFIHYVKCLRCCTALKWKSRDGTSGLRSHVQSCSPQSTSGVRRKSEVPGFLTKQALPTGVKADLIDDVVQWCAKDIRLHTLYLHLEYFFK